jgi:hypothetical protein
MNTIVVPKYLKVIKNGTKYYSSFIGGRQNIYSFVRDEPLQRCHAFLEEYRKHYKKYPPPDSSTFKLPSRDEKFHKIFTDIEKTEELQRQCLTYSSGLVIIEKFEYFFKKGFFDVRLSAADILPEIDMTERVHLLKYALLLNDTDDSERGDQDHF